MKVTRLAVKFFLLISLFASIVLAEGQMGGGGAADDGQMGGGGYTCRTEQENPDESGNCSDDEEDGLTDSALDFIKDYLASLFG